MEIVLDRHEDRVSVYGNGAFSHEFSRVDVIPQAKDDPRLPMPWVDPKGYGAALFGALFPAGTAARSGYDAHPERILLVAEDPLLQGVAWEYLHGPRGFVVCELHFVRGIAAEKRQPPPAVLGPLQVTVVPSNPAIPDNSPLPVESEWEQLQEAIQDVDAACAFTRARPATLTQLRKLVAGKKDQVIHFLGHGSRDEEENTYLCFEQENASLAPAYPLDFFNRIRGTAFLVTLNACVSATPGPTEFSNMALALVQLGVPYVLGMQFVVDLGSAQTVSHSLYADLARGTSVEEAILQARLALGGGENQPAVGIPVLYTALSAPAGGFQQQEGQPAFGEQQPQPPLELIDLPGAEKVFYGRTAELAQLGSWLTGNHRARLVTIHAGGGQGKTALAREAVRRFAWAWPGGVWASSMETIPDFEFWLARLADFLGIKGEGFDRRKIEAALLAHARAHPTLLVLDNAETFADALAHDPAKTPLSEQQQKDQTNAHQIAHLLQTLLQEGRGSLLVTSREYLGWPGEETIDLGGLSERDGAVLFLSLLSNRARPIKWEEAVQLTRAVDGHPLSLRLLAGAFLDFPGSLDQFLDDLDQQLGRAITRGRKHTDRHYSLENCLLTSWKALPPELRGAWLNLSIFNGVFLPEDGQMVLAGRDADEAAQTAARTMLAQLQQRGLLEEITSRPLREGVVRFYRMPVPARLFACNAAKPRQGEATGALTLETRRARFATTCDGTAQWLYQNESGDSRAALLFSSLQEDLERALTWTADGRQGWFRLRLGWLYFRYGFPRRGRELMEAALAHAQGTDAPLESLCRNNLGLLCRATGQSQEALRYFEQALPIYRAVGDRGGEATTLNNIGLVYRAIVQRQAALRYYEQALLIRREVGDRRGEAATLNNIGLVYNQLGQPQEALRYYEQALPIRWEVGDRSGEATTLTNIGGVHRDLGQPQEALRYYEQALAIRREVGDRSGEAATLFNMALIYVDQQPERAVDLLRQVMEIDRATGAAHSEAGDRYALAEILHHRMGRTADAVSLLQQSIQLFHQHRLERDDAGRPLAQHEKLLDELQQTMKNTSSGVNKFMDFLKKLFWKKSG